MKVELPAAIVCRDASDWMRRSMTSSFEERCSWTSTLGIKVCRRTACEPARSEEREIIVDLSTCPVIYY